MKTLAARWQHLAEGIDALALRERLLVFVAAVAVMVFAFQHWVLNPLNLHRDGLERELARRQDRALALKTEFESLGRQFAEDPDAGLRRRAAELEAALARVRADLDRRAVRLVSPSAMRDLVRDVLTAHPRVVLLEMDSLPARAMGDKAATPGNRGAAVFYRHGLRVRLRGRFSDLTRYLLALEALPWRVVWDRLELDADGYPQVELELGLSTFSRQAAWIGT